MATTKVGIVVNSIIDTIEIIDQIRKFCEKFPGNIPEAFVRNLLYNIVQTTGYKYNVMVFNLSNDKGASSVTPEGVVHHSIVNAFQATYGIWVFSGSGQWTNLGNLGLHNWAGQGNIQKCDKDGTPNYKNGRVMKFSPLFSPFSPKY